MSVFDRCNVCGIPTGVGKELAWHSDGTLSQRRDPSHRMLFYECQGMDDLFANIEKIAGISVFAQVVESKASSTIRYVRGQMFGPLGELMRPAFRLVAKELVAGTRLEGYGRIEVNELDWKKVRLDCDVYEPYSIPMVCGDIKGSFEAVRGKPVEVNYMEEEDRVRVTCSMSSQVPEPADRPVEEHSETGSGDIKHNYCPGCGVPLEVSRFEWDFEAGTIKHRELDLRMAFFAASAIQELFDKLRHELGDSIQEAIIESERRHLLSLMTLRWKIMGPADARRWLAIEGMGNMTSIEQSNGGFSMFVKNPSVPLLTVGDSLALFEYKTEQPGTVIWELTEEGDLSMQISPA